MEAWLWTKYKTASRIIYPCDESAKWHLMIRIYFRLAVTRPPGPYHPVEDSLLPREQGHSDGDCDVTHASIWFLNRNKYLGFASAMRYDLRVIACMCHYSGLLAAISLDFHRGFRQGYLPKIKLQCSSGLAARDCGAGPPPFIVVRSIRTPRSSPSVPQCRRVCLRARMSGLSVRPSRR